MPKVFNKKTDAIPPDAVCIDRTTEWGNPFIVRVHTVHQHEEAVLYFWGYAEERLKHQPHWLDPLKGKDVVCWCKPLPCHGDVLLELANKEEEVG